MKRNELVDQIRRKGTFLCVGLDPDTAKMPQCLDGDVLTFNKAIIDATAPHCVAYKPNQAFYECLGAKGHEALEGTIAYLRERYPEHLVILDAKRGDIGNTSAAYARAAFEVMGADAVTVAPYMGEDSVKPFLAYADRWTVMLALTSNPGSRDFEKLHIAGAGDEMLFERVLRKSRHWGSPVNMMYVVGATQGADDLARVRRLVPRHFLLVPGVGAQGGSLEEVARTAMIDDECGLLVNSSRGIIYASAEADYAKAAGLAAARLAAEMRVMLDNYAPTLMATVKD